MEQQPVLIKIDKRIGYITLNRPEKRNALNEEMVDSIKVALNMFEKDESVKVIILRAEGKAFCAGADLAYLQQLQQNSYEDNLADSRSLKDLFQKIYTYPKIIIAQVQGHALAGGCGLASACDFSFAVPEAKFGYTEVRIGFIPAIVLVLLLRKLGEGKAKQLLLSGETITAAEAREMGLINWIVEESNLSATVEAFAQNLITQNSGEAMALTKEMIGRVQDRDLEDALEYAASMNAKARGSEDCQKGIAAFLNKQPIQW
ncbi:Enoyl-CoA hydratase [Mariniradius saccharolyticus AK6]|uniref:Enoyl-CoA hydratase n=1 Tax=Mariniradius saccharolyticus AK6 TaxID=1239962 RepID=M7XII5_9BACT|nr:enoyl-CoA hydratase-related protein [Mariniradius saccharolyticus]EMS34649.1 Enoyl-CoA hydratase [Mariniradius saccharolyticus AK6]